MNDHFSWIKDEQKRTWIEDFYDAIECTYQWNDISNSALNSKEMEIALIDVNMLIDVDHTPESYNWTLREMKYIADYGIEKWIISRQDSLG